MGKKTSHSCIYGAYDSHIHLLGTGLKLKTLDLSVLSSPKDLAQLKSKDFHFRGNILFGFGWNDSLWDKKLWKDSSNYIWGESSYSYSEILDKYFKVPVFFVSSDGHRAWLNSLSIKQLGCSGLGLLHDNLKAEAQNKLTPYSKKQYKEALISAQGLLNSCGFTHVRDMSGEPYYWEALAELDSKLTLRIEQNMGAENPNDFSKALQLSIRAKKEQFLNIKIKGVKVYYDGSLGASSALLTENYLNQKSLVEHSKPLIEKTFLKEMLIESWSCGLDFSIHVIGNKASEDVLKIIETVILSFKKNQKFIGIVNLEHAQLLNKNSLAILARYKNIICHFQPCHFLTDRFWLKEKLTKNTLKELFCWKDLENQDSLFYFGSDSPVEPSSLFLTQQALTEAKKWGIPNIVKPWTSYHSHPDKEWVGRSYTLIDETKKQILEVCFDGKVIC